MSHTGQVSFVKTIWKCQYLILMLWMLIAHIHSIDGNLMDQKKSPKIHVDGFTFENNSIINVQKNTVRFNNPIIFRCFRLSFLHRRKIRSKSAALDLYLLNSQLQDVFFLKIAFQSIR